jgi:phosphoglycerate dehydrogenase-like enzyme
LLGATSRPWQLDADCLRLFPELRIVAKYSIGVDDVEVDAATALGILVTHCPTESNWGGVAEGAIAMMLALLKKLARRNTEVRAGRWRSDALRGTYLGARADGYPGITIGIVGLGRIGARVAELLRPWRVRLLAADPYVQPECFAEYGAEPVPLATLLGQSDVVSIHCNLTTETAGLIGAREIGQMKRGAMLINTARGSIVDVEALCDALEAGHLGGAALDVLPVEPPESVARILQTDDRVILSPHMAGANAGGTLAAAIPWATDAVLAALAGRVPDHVYNAGAIPRWTERFAARSLLPTRAARG